MHIRAIIAVYKRSYIPGHETIGNGVLEISTLGII